MIKNIIGFFRSLFDSAYYTNYGEKAYGQFSHDTHEGYGDDSVWERAFNETLACFIPEEFYNEAQSILNNQRMYFDQHFELSCEEERVMATLCCDILSKLIVWDICSVQTLDRPIDQIQISSLDTRWLDNPVVKAVPYKLHQLFHEITTDVNDPQIQLMGSEIASEINDRIIDTMFTKTGKPKTIQNNVSELYDQMMRVQKDCGKMPSWIICSREMYSSMGGYYTSSPIDRANFELVEGTIFDHPIKILIFKNLDRMSECYVGYTGGEQNILSPLYFCPYLILRLDGPLQTIGEEYDSYITSSMFCCIESSMRKKMIHKLTIK